MSETPLADQAPEPDSSIQGRYPANTLFGPPPPWREKNFPTTRIFLKDRPPTPYPGDSILLSGMHPNPHYFKYWFVVIPEPAWNLYADRAFTPPVVAVVEALHMIRETMDLRLRFHLRSCRYRRFDPPRNPFVAPNIEGAWALALHDDNSPPHATGHR